MYEGFKAALDNFTNANEDVCRPVEHHIETIHKLLNELGRLRGGTIELQNAAGGPSETSAMRVKYIEDCMTELDKCLGGLIGLTLNNANITDAMNRRRGQLIVAKGHLSSVKSQD